LLLQLLLAMQHVQAVTLHEVLLSGKQAGSSRQQLTGKPFLSTVNAGSSTQGSEKAFS
jgi:hypothetical protein